MAKAFRTTLAALAVASAFALAAGALRMRHGFRPGGTSVVEFAVVFGAVVAAFVGAAAGTAVSARLLGSRRRGASRAAAAATNAVLLGFSSLIFWRAFLPAGSSWWWVAALSGLTFFLVGAREAKDIYGVEPLRASTVWLACSVGAFAFAAPVLGLGLS